VIDLAAAHLALRNRALSLVVCTTGSTSLSATATGYARAAGSFLTDGFYVGMEILTAGFAANGYRVLRGVTASALTTNPVPAVESAAGGRTISVGLPALRAWENVTFDPTVGRPYLEEDFVPATERLLSAPAAGGEVEETGLYALKWYGIAGTDILALRTSVHALKALFTPGTKMTAGSHVVRVRTDTGPQTGQILPLTGGWSVLTLAIPWWALSTNTIAA
jgi:hypothetical protein